MAPHRPFLLSGAGYRCAARFRDDRGRAAGQRGPGEERCRKPKFLTPMRWEAPTMTLLPTDVRLAPQPCRLHLFRGLMFHAVFSKRASGQSFKTSAILS